MIFHNVPSIGYKTRESPTHVLLLSSSLSLTGLEFTGTIDVGDTLPRISDDGRFITYAAAFDAATIHATKEEPQFVSRRNIFLFDTHLGITWKITEEGMPNESEIEELCCPSASSSSQRDTCTKKKEYLGCCCWQWSSCCK